MPHTYTVNTRACGNFCNWAKKVKRRRRRSCNKFSL